MSEIGSWHSECFACGSDNDRGLRLVCRPTGDGRVAGEFRARPWMQGYPGRLQGGIIAALLDSAMTQCVHAHGVDAVTGSLRLRFTRPALLEATFTLSA